jgi:hypothetical protein
VTAVPSSVHHADGREEYTSGRLGALLSDLLTGRLPAASEAGPLLEDVRRLVTAEQGKKPRQAVVDAGPLSGQAQCQLTTHQLEKPRPAASMNAPLLQQPGLWDEL